MTVDLSSPNLWAKKYLPAVTDPKIYNVLWGGAGSGKSQTMIQSFLAELLDWQINENQTFYVIRKVASTIRNSVFEDFKRKVYDWGVASLVKIQKSTLEIHCGTNKIVFLGCDDPEKLKSLAQAKAIWIEEATELTLEDFTQITLRLRGKSQHIKRLYLTFNPISDSHWIKKRFFDSPPDNERGKILALHGTYLDALDFLDDEYPERMSALQDIDPVDYQIYALGEWGVRDRESLFLPNFKPSDHVHDGKITALQSEDLYLAFDFNVTNTCVVAQYLKNVEGHKYYASINVIKVYRMGDLSELCLTIQQEFPGFNYIINGDASGANSNAFTMENRNGYQLIQNYLNLSDLQIQIPKANPRHVASRLVTMLAFKYCRIKISALSAPEGCEMLITDLKEGKIDRHGSLDPWKNKNPDKSHALDAFRYFIFTNFAEITQKVNLSKYGMLFE